MLNVIALFFIFLISKEKCIRKRALQLRTRESTSRKNLPPQHAKNKNRYTKQPLNHLHLIRSINPTKVEEPFSIDNLISETKAKKRSKYFSFCMDKKIIFENNSIPSLPHCPKQARTSYLPNFLSSLANKSTFLTQKHLLH